MSSGFGTESTWPWLSSTQDLSAAVAVHAVEMDCDTLLDKCLSSIPK
jgi:hypothetical protein